MRRARRPWLLGCLALGGLWRPWRLVSPRRCGALGHFGVLGGLAFGGLRVFGSLLLRGDAALLGEFGVLAAWRSAAFASVAACFSAAMRCSATFASWRPGVRRLSHPWRLLRRQRCGVLGGLGVPSGLFLAPPWSLAARRSAARRSLLPSRSWRLLLRGDALPLGCLRVPGGLRAAFGALTLLSAAALSPDGLLRASRWRFSRPSRPWRPAVGTFARTWLGGDRRLPRVASQPWHPTASRLAARSARPRAGCPG